MTITLGCPLAISGKSLFVKSLVNRTLFIFVSLLDLCSREITISYVFTQEAVNRFVSCQFNFPLKKVLIFLVSSV